MIYLSYSPERGIEQVEASELPTGERIRDVESFYYAITSAEEPIYAAMPASVAALFLSASGDVEAANIVDPRRGVLPRNALPRT